LIRPGCRRKRSTVKLRRERRRKGGTRGKDTSTNVGRQQPTTRHRSKAGRLRLTKRRWSIAVRTNACKSVGDDVALRLKKRPRTAKARDRGAMTTDGAEGSEASWLRHARSLQEVSREKGIDGGRAFRRAWRSASKEKGQEKATARGLRVIVPKARPYYKPRPVSSGGEEETAGKGTARGGGSSACAERSPRGFLVHAGTGWDRSIFGLRARGKERRRFPKNKGNLRVYHSCNSLTI